MLDEYPQYEGDLRDAKEDVFVVAARYAMEIKLLGVEFDADLGPGLHRLHTLTVSVRDSTIAVVANDIPHEWLTTGTGFIDTRFSKRVATLLMELQRTAQQSGIMI